MIAASANTVRRVKSEHSTPVPQLRIRAFYGMGTGVVSTMLLYMKSKHNGGLHSARRFGTFVGSRVGTDRAERKKLAFQESMAG